MGCMAFAETLIQGAVYFDSRETLSQISKLAQAKDNEAIGTLIDDGRVSRPTSSDQEVKVTLVGNTPTSPAEFSFNANPATTYWTLSKFIAAYSRAAPQPAPSVTPNP